MNPARVSDQKYVELPEGCDVHEDKTIVYLRIVFIKVKEVDTVKEVYTAKAYIQVSNGCSNTNWKSFFSIKGTHFR